MSSIVGELISFIEASVQAAIPTIKASKHYYDLNKNDSVKNDFIFAVRPGSASSTNGTLRSVTMIQEFEIEISKDYSEKGSDDSALRAAIGQIYEENEKILREITLRKTTVLNVLSVGQPSYDAPSVNENQKSVSIIFTYPITYRKSIKGDA